MSRRDLFKVNHITITRLNGVFNSTNWAGARLVWSSSLVENHSAGSWTSIGKLEGCSLPIELHRSKKTSCTGTVFSGVLRGGEDQELSEDELPNARTVALSNTRKGEAA